MACNVADIRLIMTLGQAVDIAYPALPGFECRTANSTILFSNPSIDVETGKCYANGAASTCEEAPPAGSRICHCKPSCPQLIPLNGTAISYTMDGIETECRGGRCLTGVAAQFSCLPPFAFQDQLTVSSPCLCW